MRTFLAQCSPESLVGYKGIAGGKHDDGIAGYETLTSREAKRPLQCGVNVLCVNIAGAIDEQLRSWFVRECPC